MKWIRYVIDRIANRLQYDDGDMIMVIICKGKEMAVRMQGDTEQVSERLFHLCKRNETLFEVLNTAVNKYIITKNK